MKQIEVNIMGQGYVLGCPEGGETKLMQAVELVDAGMCKIRNAGRIKARDRIAVLAALNLAFELTEARLAQNHAPAAPSVEGDTSGAAAGQGVLARLLERLDQALGQDGQLL
ncbi:MAG: cell division protein ZapA [Burkholderiaceae bacterium]|jgi:cell division protein ZapA|nr:cell division protein ZapA [Burkholderiaceae bacterium]